MIEEFKYERPVSCPKATCTYLRILKKSELQKISVSLNILHLSFFLHLPNVFYTMHPTASLSVKMNREIIDQKITG